jgi:hypothetical protein
MMRPTDSKITSLDDAQIHRLLTLLTVLGLDLEMLLRELTKDGSDALARTRMHVDRLVQTHRKMVDELRPPVTGTSELRDAG